MRRYLAGRAERGGMAEGVGSSRGREAAYPPLEEERADRIQRGDLGKF